MTFGLHSSSNPAQAGLTCLCSLHFSCLHLIASFKAEDGCQEGILDIVRRRQEKWKNRLEEMNDDIISIYIMNGECI